MYKVTLILFVFFSLVFPTFAAPIPAPNEIHGLDQRGSGGTYTGQGTFYNPGLGACGETNSQGQFVVAIPTGIYGSGAHCGQQVNISQGGKSVRAKVVDECPGCGEGGIDMSPTVFQSLAPLTLGVVDVTWEFL